MCRSSYWQRGQLRPKSRLRRLFLVSPGSLKMLRVWYEHKSRGLWDPAALLGTAASLLSARRSFGTDPLTSQNTNVLALLERNLSSTEPAFLAGLSEPIWKCNCGFYASLAVLWCLQWKVLDSVNLHALLVHVPVLGYWLDLLIIRGPVWSGRICPQWSCDGCPGSLLCLARASTLLSLRSAPRSSLARR